MLNAPGERGPHSEARGMSARAGSHTPEPIDEVAARAMSSLLSSNLSGPMSSHGNDLAEQSRRALMDEIYAGLPQRKAETDWMLNNYFTRVDWAWHRVFFPSEACPSPERSRKRSQSIISRPSSPNTRLTPRSGRKAGNTISTRSGSPTSP